VRKTSTNEEKKNRMKNAEPIPRPPQALTGVPKARA
jgi:hypothetical protein